jgi:hypothetical protein
MAERTLRVTMDEMHEGMELEGIVRSVKDYGAFIDVGEDSCVVLDVCFCASTCFLGNGMFSGGILLHSSPSSVLLPRHDRVTSVKHPRHRTRSWTKRPGASRGRR